MTIQPIASSRPAPRVPGAAHRRARAAAATAAITALIAGGGYLATTRTGPDATRPTPTTGTEISPTALTLRDMHESVAGQYGNQAVADATVHPNAQQRRELRESVAGQYGPGR